MDDTTAGQLMKRNCPNCSGQTISVRELLFGDCRCRSCLRVIGVHRVASVMASIVIFTVAVLTTLIVLIELDLWAALLWFTLPVGALSYVKARFCPLETRPESHQSRGASGAAHRPG